MVNPELIALVKAKRELATLDDSFVAKRIEAILASDVKFQKKLDGAKSFAQFKRSKECAELVKRIRKELRTIYGVFFEEDKAKFLKNLYEDSADEILLAHKSTKERFSYYSQFYEELAKRFTPRKIIDLGCGLNPLSYRFMKETGWQPEILASDISENDMEFLQQCFDKLKIPGKTIALDLVKEHKELKKFTGDVTFMLKLLDSLEEAKRHISYDIFDSLNTEWIVVSFPTKSLGGKKNISAKGRVWFERLLERKELEWETFSIPNELVYVIRKL